MNYGSLKTTEKGPHDRGATLRRYFRLPGWCPRPPRRCPGHRQRRRSAEADQGSILLAQGDLDRQHLQPVPVLLACLLEPTLIIVRRTAVISGFVVVPHRWVVARALGPMTATAQGPRATPEVLAVIVTLAVIGIMLHRFVHQNRKRLPPP